MKACTARFENMSENMVASKDTFEPSEWMTKPDNKVLTRPRTKPQRPLGPELMEGFKGVKAGKIPKKRKRSQEQIEGRPGIKRAKTKKGRGKKALVVQQEVASDHGSQTQSDLETDDGDEEMKPAAELSDGVHNDSAAHVDKPAAEPEGTGKASSSATQAIAKPVPAHTQPVEASPKPVKAPTQLAQKPPSPPSGQIQKKSGTPARAVVEVTLASESSPSFNDFAVPTTPPSPPDTPPAPSPEPDEPTAPAPPPVASKRKKPSSSAKVNTQRPATHAARLFRGSEIVHVGGPGSGDGGRVRTITTVARSQKKKIARPALKTVPVPAGWRETPN